MGSWTKKQGSSTIRADMKTRGGRQRGGRSQEKEGRMHGTGLRIIGKEVGTGDHGGRGAWGGEKRMQGWDSARRGSLRILGRRMTQTSTPGRAYFFTQS